LIPIHRLATELAIHGVKIDPVSSGNQGQRLIQIRTKFLRRPRPPGMVPGHGKTTSQASARVLKSGHVIALPAMQ
jgi:hypothetical protein